MQTTVPSIGGRREISMLHTLFLMFCIAACMAVAVKFQVVRGPDDGTESCDYTGPNFKGSGDGEHHRTLVRSRSILLRRDW